MVRVTTQTLKQMNMQTHTQALTEDLHSSGSSGGKGRGGGGGGGGGSVRCVFVWREHCL